MNPSTSLNAEPAREATFKVSTRQLSLDLSTAGVEHNARELGQLPASQLNPLLLKLAEFAPEQMLEADPHLVVSGRRGRFLIRPARGKLRLFDANDATRAPLEIDAPQAADYLDGSELKPVEAPAEIPLENLDKTNRRMGLVVALLCLSTALVAGSAYFTFRPRAIDDDVKYSAITAPAQLAALRQQVTNSFATGSGDGSRRLTLRADGTLTLIEYGLDNIVADERTDTYQLVLRENIPVARTGLLGPIEVRDAKTLVYAGEIYTRQP